ncbi:hypothetical protein GBAR_LOCUS18606 [Geodia barretti]|nr:hypothetical protein GBAR_LOCUS18606 [Geodia barretti]
MVMTLPEVPPSSSTSLPLHLTFPPSSPSSLDKMSSGDTDSTHYHQLSVLLEGAGEPLKGRIYVPVRQPLTLTHCEHSAGESTYLQLSLENTSPAPLLLSSPSLSVDLSTTQLHTQLPLALDPGGNFSCIWQTQPYSRSVGEDGKAVFTLQYRPLIADQETSHVDLSYAFPVSNMRTVFHSQLFISSLGDTPVTAGKVAVLKYVISNVAIGLPLSHLPDNLHYTISDPADLWQFHDSSSGVIGSPTPGMSDQICVRAVPSKPGALAPPRLTFRVPRVGSRVDESDCKGAEMVVLTPAQVYELSLGETVTVVVG